MKAEEIFFEINMELYDKFCVINENLGDMYTFKDLVELQEIEKQTEIKMYKDVIRNLVDEINMKEKVIDLMAEVLNNFDFDKQCEKCQAELINKSHLCNTINDKTE